MLTENRGETCQKPRKTHHSSSDDRIHRDVWELARKLCETCSEWVDVFPKFSDNTSMNSGRETERTRKWLLQHRSSVGKSDASTVSCPEIYQHVGKLPVSGRDDSKMRVLSQKGMLHIAYQ